MSNLSKKRVKVEAATPLEEMDKSELINIVKKQRKSIKELETKLAGKGASSEKMSETKRKEEVLILKIATKEQEIQELNAQVYQLQKATLNSQLSQIHKSFLDPSISLLFNRVMKESEKMKKTLEETEEQLSAWKFTTESQQGKRLIARCRQLLAENKELGIKLSDGRVSQLEAEIALQKKSNEELKLSQEETNVFVEQLDEEVEGMQSTIQEMQHSIAEKDRLIDDLERQLDEKEQRIGDLVTSQGEFNDEARQFQEDGDSYYDNRSRDEGRGEEEGEYRDDVMSGSEAEVSHEEEVMSLDNEYSGGEGESRYDENVEEEVYEQEVSPDHSDEKESK